jgi:hypothetical protein
MSHDYKQRWFVNNHESLIMFRVYIGLQKDPQWTQATVRSSSRERMTLAHAPSSPLV